MPFKIEKLVFEALDDHFVRGFGFTCGNRSIDHFLLMDMAYLDQALGLSQTTLALYEGEVTDTIAPKIGCKFLFLEALDDPELVRWYSKFGFIQTIGESSDFKTPMRMPILQKTPFPEY